MKPMDASHNTTIHVDRVSKRFRLGSGNEYSRLTEVIASNAKNWLSRNLLGAEAKVAFNKDGRADERFEGNDFWALRDVSFSIARGEVVGVVGHNGAGKSTLLKILSRIVTPTSGRVGVRGRVGSLLEVGTGFHPELTGRENIYLNGAILGLQRSEIKKRFEQIVEFAEIAPFLDTPVKRYSSGMTVRLGFSVAAHLQPDVLIIDEVLSVGDQAFQRKCMGKATELGSEGRTVLVVSHNLAAISNMCSRALLIDAGRLGLDGVPSQVIEKYLLSMNSMDGLVEWGEQEAPQSPMVRLRRVAVRGKVSETPTPQVDIDREIELAVEYDVLRDNAVNCVQIHLRDETGVFVFSSANAPSMNSGSDLTFGRPLQRGRYRSVCKIPANFLNDSRYVVSVFLGPEVGQPTIACDSVLSFVVHDTGAMRREYLGSWHGPVIRPRLDWSTESLG